MAAALAPVCVLTACILLPPSALACPTADDLMSGGVRVVWEGGRAGVYERNFRGELMFLADDTGGEVTSGVMGADGLDRSVTGSVDGLSSATIHFVYSFDLPNEPPKPNAGQKGVRGAFVDGVLASSSAYAWEAGALSETVIGDCTYATIPFQVTLGEGASAIKESRLWLPELGINLPVEIDDGFVVQTHPPVEITAR